MGISPRRWRSLLLQGLTLAALAFVVWQMADNAISSLQRQGIASGFGFLGETSGFAVGQSLIPYSESSTYGRALVVGLLNTLLVAVLGVILATLLGFTLGVARLSRNWLIAKLAAAYVEIARNIPLLLQIFFWYFAFFGGLPAPRRSIDLPAGAFLHNRGLALPKPVFDDAGLLIASIILALGGFCALALWARRRRVETGKQFPLMRAGLALCLLPLAVFFLTGRPVELDFPALTGFNFEGGLTISREFAALLIALATYTAAFIAEIVRAGIMAVPRGQSEAAYALGLKPGTTLRLIIIPQALRVIIPPLTSQYLNLTKNSSLAVAIAYPDLVSVFAGTTLNQTGQAIEVIFLTMCIYLFLSLTTALAMNYYNARINRTRR